jgi:hypothetical protein
MEFPKKTFFVEIRDGLVTSFIHCSMQQEKKLLK